MTDCVKDDKLHNCIRALRLIKQEYGKVCGDFLSCSHESCKSSCASWMVADMTLKMIEEEGPNPYSRKELDNLYSKFKALSNGVE